MASRTSIDEAGRIGLSKSLRKRLRLEPGDNLLIEAHDDSITLRPIRKKARLKKVHGIWVFDGGPCNFSIPALIDRVREKRIQEIIQCAIPPKKTRRKARQDTR